MMGKTNDEPKYYGDPVPELYCGFLIGWCHECGRRIFRAHHYGMSIHAAPHCGYEGDKIIGAFPKSGSFFSGVGRSGELLEKRK